MSQKLKYLNGFGNELSSEAVKGSLPEGQFSPQVAPKGLYAEQLNGTAFTAPRSENRRTWVYKIRPSVVFGKFKKIRFNDLWISSDEKALIDPSARRWMPYVNSSKGEDFWESLRSIVVCQSAKSQSGGAVHLYSTKTENAKRYFYNSDAEMVFVPWHKSLLIRTELGNLELKPGEVGLIPRGIKIQVLLPEKESSGYLMENYGMPFRLPELGPIGANGLANKRDFLSPVAAFDEKASACEIVNKFGGQFFLTESKFSPLDVVAWTGNCLPVKYDLFQFNTMGTISYDHPDPSIFTVLTSPSDRAGTANMDFVIFPPRWLVGENTFRPPYYHRNFMSEYMGLVTGTYDAKEEGFVPGGSSLHNCMTGHGPESSVFEKASNAELKPQKLDKTMAFMFETRWLWHPTEWAMSSKLEDKNYAACWDGLKASFKTR